MAQGEEELTEAEKALSNEISQKIASGSTFTSEYLETMLSKVTADKIPYILSKADDNGLTPLMHAARTNPNLVNLFVEKGADIYATDDNGKTLIDYTSKETVNAVTRIVRKKIASDIQDAILEDI